jgi:hypothetical protein
MWSIVDLNTGEILYEDEFKEPPSAIVDDKFCVRNGDGFFDYYSISNVSQPINSESYLRATAFNESGIALTVKKGEGIALINEKCEVVKKLDKTIQEADEFCNGYSVIRDESGKMGYIDETGDIVIKPKYDFAFSFSEDGIAIVGNEGVDSLSKFAAIDIKGKELFSFSSKDYRIFSDGYINISEFKHGYLPLQKENKEVVLLDKNGKEVISVGKWNDYSGNGPYIYNGVMIFKEGDSYGLKDENGKIIIRAKYDSIDETRLTNKKDYYLAKKQGKFGIIDKNDNIILPFIYDDLIILTKAILLQGDSKSYSLMNIDGDDISEINFSVYSLSNGSRIISNYFNADSYAKRFMENVTESSFFNTKEEQKLYDYSEYLSGYKYADMSTCAFYGEANSYRLAYIFDKTLSSESYEYSWGYRFSSGPEYNYNANLVACATILDLSQYQSGAEESFINAIEKRLGKIGFTKSTDFQYYYVNKDSGTAIGFGYKNGIVEIRYVYDYKYILDLTREKRNKGVISPINDFDSYYDDEALTIEAVELADSIANVINN